MPIYHVRPGKRFGARDEYGPGDELELTESEAGGFLDKLELENVDVPVPEAPAAPMVPQSKPKAPPRPKAPRPSRH